MKLTGDHVVISPNSDWYLSRGPGAELEISIDAFLLPIVVNCNRPNYGGYVCNSPKIRRDALTYSVALLTSRRGALSNGDLSDKKGLSFALFIMCVAQLR